jgi:hypothetical protein
MTDAKYKEMRTKVRARARERALELVNQPVREEGTSLNLYEELTNLYEVQRARIAQGVTSEHASNSLFETTQPEIRLAFDILGELRMLTSVIMRGQQSNKYWMEGPDGIWKEVTIESRSGHESG